MTTNRWRAMLACLFLASGTALGAQQTPPVRDPTPPLTAPARPETSIPSPAATDDDRDVFRWHRRPIVRVAQDYTLRAGDTVREIQVVFGDVRIEGSVDQDVVVVLGSAHIAPTADVGGSVAVFGGSATVEPGARIRRDLIVGGGTLNAPELFSPDGYQVIIGSPWLGAVLEDMAPWITRGLLWGRLIVPGIGWVWTAVGIFFLVYLVLNTVFDRAVGDSARAIADRPLSMFMTGFLVLLLSLPAIIIVAATVIGLALVPFLICALIVAALIGKTAVARAIGASVLRSESDSRAHAAVAFILGFAVLTLAYMVPLVGFVTWALTSVLGFGAAASTFRAMLRRERPVPPPAPPAPPAPPSGDDPRAPLAPLAVPEPPQPRPAFTEGLAQYPRATFLDRVAAFALDAILVAIATAVMDLHDEEGMFLFLLLAYHIAFWAWRGTTLGGIICSVRVIRTHGADVRFQDSLVRGLASIFSLAALGIGCLWMLQDSERQMWHDKIAGTLVVKVPRELVLV